MTISESPGDYCWVCGVVRDEHADADHQLVPFPPDGYEERGRPAPKDTPCVFCKIVRDEAPATLVRVSHETTAFVPLNPVTDGHILVVPNAHVADALENPLVTAAVMRRVAELAVGPCNIITSVGSEATQSVFHFHVHIVPRRDGDGLALPWTVPAHLEAEFNTLRVNAAASGVYWQGRALKAEARLSRLTAAVASGTRRAGE